MDLTLWEYNAVLVGYQNHILDLKVIAVEQGYYAALYSNSKRAKPATAIATLQKERQSSRTIRGLKKENTLNVEAIQCLEAAFKEVGACPVET